MSEPVSGCINRTSSLGKSNCPTRSLRLSWKLWNAHNGVLLERGWMSLVQRTSGLHPRMARVRKYSRSVPFESPAARLQLYPIFDSKISLVVFFQHWRLINAVCKRCQLWSHPSYVRLSIVLPWKAESHSSTSNFLGRGLLFIGVMFSYSMLENCLAEQQWKVCHRVSKAKTATLCPTATFVCWQYRKQPILGFDPGLSTTPERPAESSRRATVRKVLVLWVSSKPALQTDTLPVPNADKPSLVRSGQVEARICCQQLSSRFNKLVSTVQPLQIGIQTTVARQMPRFVRKVQHCLTCLMPEPLNSRINIRSNAHVQLERFCYLPFN